MKESWRWFGPLDRIPLPEIAQTGASGVVTALHEIPYGEVWSVEAIRARQDLVARAGVGRTFQTASVFEQLTVLQNLDIAAGAGRHVCPAQTVRRLVRDQGLAAARASIGASGQGRGGGEGPARPP